MEDIYLNGAKSVPRVWCSEKIDFKTYFYKYSELLRKAQNKKLSEIDILQTFAPASNQLSEEELSSLEEMTSGSNLTTLYGNDLKKLIRSNIESQKTSTSKNSLQDASSSNARPNTDYFSAPSTLVRGQKNRLLAKGGAVGRKEVPVDGASKLGQKNLYPKRAFMISFRIHEPYHHVKDYKLPGKCIQQISVLGHQPLTALRDKIICESDYQDVRGDVSGFPDIPPAHRAMDLYSSSMFYFDNTFYVDKRDNNNIDFSTTIRKWGDERGIIFGETEDMDMALVGNLKIRLGYPYVFMHQGCCEHIVIVNDARLLSSRDSLYSGDYPLVEKITQTNMKYCMTCSRHPARWIVRESSRLVHDPTFLCKRCFKMFNYIDGKKIGNFKAYQYWQRSTIL